MFAGESVFLLALCLAAHPVHGATVCRTMMQSSRALGSDMQWNQPTEKKLTGGNNWQAKTSTSTTWNAVPVPPAPQMVPAPVTYPVNTPQVPVYGMVPTQIGTAPIMAPQPMIYTQTGLRPNNPFAPISGTQIQFM